MLRSFIPNSIRKGLDYASASIRAAGILHPERAETLIEQIQYEKVTVPEMILKRFVKRFRR